MKILIAGNFGNGNNGDEVVLMAMLRQFRQLDASVRIAVISGDPASTAKLHGVAAVRRGFSPEMVHAIAQSDVVIIGGGGILIDQAHSSLKYGLVILAARLFQKPVMVYAIGVDTITGKVARAAVRSSFNQATLIALRDEGSRTEMRRLGVTAPPTYVTADPAFLLDGPDQRDFRKTLTQAGIYDKQEAPLIGVSVWPADNLFSYRQIPQIFAELGDRLVAQYGCKLMLLVMSTIGFEGDLDASHRIAEAMKHRDRVRVLGADYTPQALMAAFGQMDLVIGMRYHSLVLATIANVPLIGIERAKYPKNTYFLREVRQLSGGMAGSLTVERLEACVAEAWGTREELSRRLASASVRLRARAGHNVRLFNQLLLERGIRRGARQTFSRRAPGGHQSAR